MTSSITTAVVWLACPEKSIWTVKGCWHFCTFLHNPHFDFEPDSYAIRKLRKGRFQRYIVRTEIFSTFHTWVEYISVKTVIGKIDLPTPRAAMTPQSIYRLVTERRTDGIKHHNISAVHCVHLADIINWGKAQVQKYCTWKGLQWGNDWRTLKVITIAAIR